MAKPVGTHTKIIKNWRLKIRNFQAKLGSGFTLPELLVSIGIIGILISLVTINLTYSQRHASVNTTITTLVSDFKEQQIKAMIGDTEGRATSDDYGIYIMSGQYVLFHGATYTPGDLSNRAIPIETTLQFLNPNYAIIFSRISGDVLGYNPLANTIILRDTTNNEQKIIEFNTHGVITSVN